MSGFTPGPWVIKEGERFQHDSCITTEDRVSGGIVPITEVNTDWDEKFSVEQKANALLIAAAPDLYEALHALVNEPTKAPDFLPSRLWDAARAALAKAEGKS